MSHKMFKQPCTKGRAQGLFLFIQYGKRGYNRMKIKRGGRAPEPQAQIEL